MTDIVLTPITSGYNLAKVNDNFDKIEESINNDVMNLSGGNNVMLQDLDMNGKALLNVATDPNNPDSMLTVEAGDLRYYNVDGDTLTGPMNVNGQVVTNLPVPLQASSPVRKDQLDQEVAVRASADQTITNNYQAADASLQAQINGTNPPMGSAFSVVSWHDQVVTNSVNIPASKNAWSFGPTLTIAPGQTVSVGAGSFWTIANGEVN